MSIKESGIYWEGIPFCNCEQIAKYAIQNNDILIARTGGTTGKTVLVKNPPFETVYASYLIRLSVKHDVNPLYVYSFLNSYAFWNQIVELKQGTAQPNVNAERMKELLIPVSPKTLQDSISNYLGNNEIANEFIEKIDTTYQKVLAKFDSVRMFSTQADIQSIYLAQLRQTILQEAIAGKLTAQWRCLRQAQAAVAVAEPVEATATAAATSSPGPALVEGPGNPETDATALLAVIKAEKQKLIAEKKIAKENPLPPIRAEEMPFDLPAGWVWCRLGACSINRDDTRQPISQNERQNRKKIFPYYGASGVIDRIDGYTHEGKNLLIGEDGANLVSRTTPIAFVADGKYWVNNHAHVIGFADVTTLSFVEIHINAMDLILYITGGFQPKLNQQNLNQIVITLPPLAEQRAIVERVGRLLALVDQLAAQVAERKGQAAALMQAVLRAAFAG